MDLKIIKIKNDKSTSTKLLHMAVQSQFENRKKNQFEKILKE